VPAVADAREAGNVGHVGAPLGYADQAAARANGAQDRGGAGSERHDANSLFHFGLHPVEHIKLKFSRAKRYAWEVEVKSSESDRI